MNGNVWEWTEDWYDANYKTSLSSDLIENGVTSTKSIRGVAAGVIRSKISVRLPA